MNNIHYFLENLEYIESKTGTQFHNFDIDSLSYWEHIYF